MESINTNPAVLQGIMKGYGSITEQVMAERAKPVYSNPNFDFYLANSLDKDNIEKYKKREAKIEVANRFKGNLEKLMTHWNMTIHSKWIQAIKDYQLTSIDRAIELKRKKMLFLTNEKIPIVRAHVDRTMKALFDGKFTGKVYGAQGKDKSSNKEFVQHYANRIYSCADIRSVVIEIGYDSILLGNGFLRTGYDPIPFNKEEIVKLFKSNDDKLKPVPIVVDDPLAKAEYVSPFNLYAEPYTDFYQQPIYHRYIDSIGNVKENYKNFFSLDESQLDFILRMPQYFSTKNYNKIKLIKYYEDFLLTNSLGYSLNDLYTINPKSQSIEVIEYEYENNFAVILNGYLVYDGINPYHYEGRKAKHRYKTLCSNKQGGTWVGQGQGISLGGIQKLYDALFNIMFDLAKFAAGPMFIVEPGQWIEGCETQLNYDPFSIKKSRGLQDAKLNTLELPKPDAVNFTMMNNLLEYANMLISPTVYNQIQTQSRSATDSEYRKEGLKTQLNDLAEDYGVLFDSMLKDYIMYAKKSLGEHELDILNIEEGNEVWKTITAKKLEGNYIYETEFESLRDLNAVIDRSQYVQLLDVITRVGQDPVTGRFLVDMKKILSKGLELFDQDSGAILKDDEYYKLLQEAQMGMMNVQKNISEAQRAMGITYPQEGGEGQPEEQGSAPVEPEQPLTTANILSQVRQ